MEPSRRGSRRIFGSARVLVSLVAAFALAALPACLGEEPAGPDCAVIAQAVSQCDDEPLAPDFMAECEAASVAEREAMAVAGQACAARKADGIFGYLDEGEECWSNHVCDDGLICRLFCPKERCEAEEYLSTCQPPGGVGDGCDAGVAGVLIPEGEHADCAEGLLCWGWTCSSDVGGACRWNPDCTTLHCSTNSLIDGFVGTCLQ